ncbi:MAG: cytochrome C, partial [Acidobacteria bacterium]|nr:cytochrome C [Acidobacteriota bacterium]
SVDVHMAVEGVNLQCVDCHKTKEHNISGKLYSLSSMNKDRVFCEDCHTSTPHEEEIINEHTLKVSCQACHIPVYAKVNYTKTYWDWSTAGKLKNGEPFVEEDEHGNHKYMSIKGSFEWGKNLKPNYVWFNGNASHYIMGDKVEDPSKPLLLNPFYGSYNDEDSKIIPVKIHTAKQPFDPINKILILPKLYDPNKGAGAFWKDFDWVKASEVGMKEQNLPFSRKVDFIETKMYWPVNHMVSQKENSLSCYECHTRSNSRIANLTDFYIPGRDYSKIVDRG